jgi:hypothetical protein
VQNLGYATCRGPALRVRHVPGAKYLDLWNDRQLKTRVEGDSAELSVEIGPREVGCIAQQTR